MYVLDTILSVLLALTHLFIFLKHLYERGTIIISV